MNQDPTKLHKLLSLADELDPDDPPDQLASALRQTLRDEHITLSSTVELHSLTSERPGLYRAVVTVRVTFSDGLSLESSALGVCEASNSAAALEGAQAIGFLRSIQHALLIDPFNHITDEPVIVDDVPNAPGELDVPPILGPFDEIGARFADAGGDPDAWDVYIQRVEKPQLMQSHEIDALVAKLDAMSHAQLDAWLTERLDDSKVWFKRKKQWASPNTHWWAVVKGCISPGKRDDLARDYYKATCHRLRVHNFGELTPSRLGDEFDDLEELGTIKRLAKIEREIEAWRLETQPQAPTHSR